jgi:VWFA-related protein
MVVAIGSETAVLARLSTDHGAAADAVDRLDVWGTTALYDAALAAIDAVQPAKGRRALVLLSDGIDRYSRTTAAMLVVEAHRRDVLIYPIAIGGGTRPPVFAELAAATGGRSFAVKDPRDLPSTLGSIARELRFQYLLGYSSSQRPVDEPQWRAIRVAVNRPGARVRARTGYLAK